MKVLLYLRTIIMLHNREQALIPVRRHASSAIEHQKNQVKIRCYRRKLFGLLLAPEPVIRLSLPSSTPLALASFASPDDKRTMALPGKGKKRTTDAKTSSHSKRHKPAAPTQKKSGSSSAAPTNATTQDEFAVKAKKYTGAFPTEKPAKSNVKKGHNAIAIVDQVETSDDDSEQESGGEMEVDQDLEDNFLMSLDVKGMTVYVGLSTTARHEANTHILYAPGQDRLSSSRIARRSQ